MKPFLKWAGGKRQILPAIKTILIDHGVNTDDVTYYEPFVGGGSVFLDLAKENCVINDYNEEIINTYKMIKDHSIGLMRMLKTHELRNSPDYYYQMRELDRSDEYIHMGKTKKAARTIYLNKTCFNGLYRVNNSGYFNTPVGSYTNPLICDKDNILAIHDYLNNNNVQLLSGDFTDAVPNHKIGDIIYFDPPYDYVDQKGFVKYSAKGFTRDDLIRLKEFCDTLIDDRCNVLISNNDTPFVRATFASENYKIYTIQEIETKRSITSKGEDRNNKVPEVLIYGTRNN